jgi:hypothetical protein
MELVNTVGLLVQFLIELDGTFRNGNQLELVLKY